MIICQLHSAGWDSNTTCHWSRSNHINWKRRHEEMTLWNENIISSSYTLETTKTEEHHKCYYPVLYDIIGKYHCLLPLYRTLQNIMNFINQKIFGYLFARTLTPWRNSQERERHTSSRGKQQTNPHRQNRH